MIVESDQQIVVVELEKRIQFAYELRSVGRLKRRKKQVQLACMLMWWRSEAGSLVNCGRYMQGEGEVQLSPLNSIWMFSMRTMRPAQLRCALRTDIL